MSGLSWTYLWIGQKLFWQISRKWEKRNINMSFITVGTNCALLMLYFNDVVLFFSKKKPLLEASKFVELLSS